MSKTITLHVHHAFFVHFFAVPAQLQPDWPNFELTWGREWQGDKKVKGWLGIGAEKFQRTRSLFFSDIFIGVDGTVTINKDLKIRGRDARAELLFC